MTFSVTTIIIALVLIYAVVSGFMKGLLSQIGQIAGLIIGILASRALTPEILNMLSVDAGVDTASTVTMVLCYIVVYLAAYFSVVLVAKLIKLVVKVACLGVLDRIGGSVFKLLKWALILSLVYNLLVAIHPASAPGANSNVVERSVYHIAPALLDMWNSKTS